MMEHNSFHIVFMVESKKESFLFDVVRYRGNLASDPDPHEDHRKKRGFKENGK